MLAPSEECKKPLLADREHERLMTVRTDSELVA
jgi:hypothetical protein